MKLIPIFIFLISVSVFGLKPLPPGSGVSVKPNVLFIIDNSGSMGSYSSSGKSRIWETKTALQLLLNDSNITSSIRLGLSQFPTLGYSNRRMILSPVNEGIDEHIDDIREKVGDPIYCDHTAGYSRYCTSGHGIVANGGTPLGNALYLAGKYYKNEGVASVICFGDVNCESPIVHRCQKNYVVLFTDGGECCNNSYSGGASSEATRLYNNILSGYVPDGGTDPMHYTRIETYAIAFGGGTNVDYIASAGGTGQGYEAGSPQELLNVFNSIISEISAKNITSTTPTLVPSFDSEGDNVIYQAQFVPRDERQWEGKFYKYVLNNSGFIDLGAHVWEASNKLPATNSRVIWTLCKDRNDVIYTEFKASGGESVEPLNDCLFMQGGTGAGNPVEICDIDAGPWSEFIVNWEPDREPPVYTCKNSFRDQIYNSIHSYRYICDMWDFEEYSGGSCYDGGCGYQCESELIERYLCQYNNTCDCYSSWLGDPTDPNYSGLNVGHAKACTNNSQCQTTTQPDALCIDNFCVGKEIYQNDPNVWDRYDSGYYENNLNQNVMLGQNAGQYDMIEIDFENLKFNADHNGNLYYDYAVIQGIGGGQPEYYVSVGDGRIFDCGNGPTYSNVGGHQAIDITFCNEVLPAGQTRTLQLPFPKAKVTFVSNGSGNDIALFIPKYRVKEEDQISCHWENGGPGTGEESDDIQNAKKMINFFRGKDSYGEDHTLSDPNICAVDTPDDTTCPDRGHRLGDIYNSQAKYFGKPHQNYTYTDYQTFKNANPRTGEDLIIVGGNDGMIHAFSVSTGVEIWAYVPPNLLPRLKNVLNGENGTKSEFFVDRSPKIMDVYNTATSQWRSVLMIGFGEGGAGLMAIDITDSYYTTTSPTFLWAVYNESPEIPESTYYNTHPDHKDFRRVLYWNSSGSILAYQKNIPDALKGTDLDMTNYYDYSNLYNTWSEPIVGQLGANSDGARGQFVAVLGGGGLPEAKPNSGEGEYGGAVYFIDIFTGAIKKRFNIPTHSAIAARVPAGPAVLPDYKNIDNRAIKLVYIPDLAGRVWRLDPDTSSDVIDCGSNAKCRLMFNGEATLAKKDYIYQSLNLAYDTDNPADPDTNVWIYFGTGNSDIYDITQNEGENYLYAIKDQTWDTGDVPSVLTPSDLNSANNTNCDTDRVNGWKYALAGKEKLVATPFIHRGYVFYTVYEHGEDNGGTCSGHLGTSYLYSFELTSGCYHEEFTSEDDGSNRQAKAYLGQGVATAPVVKGQGSGKEVMYFGISGDGSNDSEDPIFNKGERKENLIKWEFKTPENEDPVPFSFFREIF